MPRPIQLDAQGIAHEQIRRLTEMFPTLDFQFGETPSKEMNAYRASYAARALQTFGDLTADESEEPLEQVFRDLLSDLMHLCDLFVNEDGDVVAFDGLLDRARARHQEEVAGL